MPHSSPHSSHSPHKPHSPHSPSHSSQRQRSLLSSNLLRRTCILLVLACIISSVAASSGDAAFEYLQCVAACKFDYCRTPPSDPSRPPESLPLALRLTGWTCLDNCRYGCMQEITSISLALNRPVHQYYGKWPFYRFLGMQEPASVLFSLLNGYMHARGYLQIKRIVPASYTMHPFYLVYALVGMNTWLWSAVYHSRDWPSTEKLDYFSAGASVMYGLYYSVVRVARIKPGSRLLVWWSLACLIPLLMHIGYLGLVHFDYGYNMAATATVGAMHNIVWIGWSVKHWRNKKQASYAWMPGVWAVLITMAMGLELLDFTPVWGVVDAHALWHCATIPLVASWYRFLIRDSEHEISGRRSSSNVFGSSYCKA